jgi:hypothetical protein
MIALSPSGIETDPVLIRILIAAIGPAVTVLLAWLVGHKLSAKWAERQKSRELAILGGQRILPHLRRVVRYLEALELASQVRIRKRPVIVCNC